MAHRSDADARADPDRDSAPHGHQELHGQLPGIFRDLSYRRDLPPHLATALRAARHEVGLTLRQLSQVTGISASHICRLEGGSRCPSVEVAQELVRWLPLEEGVADELLRTAVVKPVYP